MTERKETRGRPAQTDRNLAVAAFAETHTQSETARAFKISRQRVLQILQDLRRPQQPKSAQEIK